MMSMLAKKSTYQPEQKGNKREGTKIRNGPGSQKIGGTFRLILAKDI